MDLCIFVSGEGESGREVGVVGRMLGVAVRPCKSES